MNIFIDSNILFKDYFFDNKFNEELLNIAIKKQLNIFISSIVLLELRRQYKDLLLEKNNKIKSLLKDNSKYRIPLLKIEQIDIDSQLQLFDEFYRDIEKKKILKILDFNNDFLPELINRAINRKMPFREGKSEFMDAIIWLTYSKYVETEKLDNCILLTNNTKDFCIKNEKERIHSELQNDTKKFKVYNSTFSFINKENQTLDLVPKRVSNWINSLKINEDFTWELICEFFQDHFDQYILDEISEYRLGDFYDFDDCVPSGYIVPNYVEINDINNVETTIINEKVIISGNVLGMCIFDAFINNPNYDSDFEDSYFSKGTVTVKIRFAFDYNRNKMPKNIEFHGLSIEKIE